MAKATAKKTWKTAQFALPISGWSSWRPLTSVRISGEEIQVQVSRNISLPYYESAASYAKEILEAAEGLVDERIEFIEGDENNSSEQILKGWRVANDAELAIIKEGREDAKWQPLTW